MGKQNILHSFAYDIFEDVFWYLKLKLIKLSLFGCFFLYNNNKKRTNSKAEYMMVD